MLGPKGVLTLVFTTPWRYLFIAVCLGALCTATACRMPWPGKPPQVKSAPSPAAQKAYAEALEAYHDGDYALAAKRFTAIRESTSDRRLARVALFGLACAKLMLAETPEAYLQAIELWDRWIDNAPDVSHSEDVRLVGPLIHEKMLYSNLPPAEQDATAVEDDDETKSWLFVRTKQELDRLREKLQTTEALGQKQKKKIRLLEREIGRLKRQIIALEAIDQKIQEKKTAIPSTEKTDQ